MITSPSPSAEVPPTSASLNSTDGPPSSQSPVNVDLGPLKSVSRLHARIEYKEEEAHFVLIVIGCNGAWVDSVWSGSSSWVPLGESSQIQIASRTLHFMLPPPATVEDSPSPSSASSVQRAHSPFVDITSISPHPPSLPPPKLSCSPNPQLPNSNTIPRIKAPSASMSTSLPTPAASTSKKCKKTSNPPPKLEAIGGKATLQDLCGWMMDHYDWYRYNEGAGWKNSVHHNLSSGCAFKKMERSTGEHGKGFFWSINPQYEHTFEEQEAGAAAQAQSVSSSTFPASSKDSGSKSARKKDKAPLDPPLKWSVKSGAGLLPPLLTSMPLAFPLKSASGCRGQAPSPGQLFMTVPRTVTTGNLGPVAQKTKSEPADPPQICSTVAVRVRGLLTMLSSVASSARTSTNTPTPGVVSALSNCGTSSSTNVSSVPSSSSVSSSLLLLSQLLSVYRLLLALSRRHTLQAVLQTHHLLCRIITLVLSPLIFSSLVPEQLKALEEMGAQKAFISKSLI
ncbi:hypothetical protein L210DRAFT_981807 [Boletus edulis BED1]|uniref:Uncharacterized protein n=1 Tax=Boletus edulis BED1 TaxID=1328754 RepID=A0AAD4GE69_BOLED|nr:hypothetical protein L210DRAFT_981807 [Boletus edulis BED1]